MKKRIDLRCRNNINFQEKNDKQKLDQQFQKIQQIMKKRDESKSKGEKISKPKYWF